MCLCFFLVMCMVWSSPVASDSSLYDITGETKYEWEILHRGDIRYIDFLKKLRRYESRIAVQGLPLERYSWPIVTNSKLYECSVPFLLPQRPQKSKREEDVSMEVSPFLESLLETCIYRWEGWWTYEFCYGKHIRQFHQEQDGTIPAQFHLGQYTGTTSGAPGPEFYSEEYEGGSSCDLTGKARTCEIRFYCDPQSDLSVFSSIKEPSSCNYIVRIDTPLLCKHPKYISKLEEDTEKILCFETPVPTEQEVLEEEKIRKQKSQQTAAQQASPQKNTESSNAIKIEKQHFPQKPKTDTFSEKRPIQEKTNPEKPSLSSPSNDVPSSPQSLDEPISETDTSTKTVINPKIKHMKSDQQIEFREQPLDEEDIRLLMQLLNIPSPAQTPDTSEDEEEEEDFLDGILDESNPFIPKGEKLPRKKRYPAD